MPKRILVIGFSNIAADARISKFVKALNKNFEITTLAFGQGLYEHHFIKLKQAKKNKGAFIMRHLLLLTKQFKKYSQYNYSLEGKLTETYDLIITNDADSLPLAISISNDKIPIWADLHEYATEEFTQSFLWRLLYQPYKAWLLKKYISQVQFVSTVCKEIAELYEKDYQISYVQTIENRAYSADLTPQNVSEKIKLIHQGLAMPERKLEDMISTLEILGPQYELHFLLQCNTENQKKYKQLLINLGKGKRIYFHEPIPSENIPSFINQFDIGLFQLPPVNTNWKLALPNKIFDFIQARLAIAITPNLAMKALVEQYNLGMVAKDYSSMSMAEAIQAASKDKIFFHKQQAHAIANKLSFEKNQSRIIEIANELID